MVTVLLNHTTSQNWFWHFNLWHFLPQV